MGWVSGEEEEEGGRGGRQGVGEDEVGGVEGKGQEEGCARLCRDPGP